MVKLTKDKVVIEFPHPLPDDVVYDIKCAIVNALLNQGEGLNMEQQKGVNYFLLLLLSAMMYERHAEKKALKKGRK